VNTAPSLPVHNRFSILNSESTITQFTQSEKLLPVALHPPDPGRLKTPFYRRPAWEKRLPARYVLAATPSSKSLSLKVSIQTTDTGEVFATPALVDCGATGQFMDAEFVRRNRLTTRQLARAIPVFNVDGTRNDAGSVTEIVDTILRYNDHTERTSFAVTNLGKQDIILGFTWLEEHNPEINWQTKEVKMSRCPDKCLTCRAEIRKEASVRRHKRKVEVRRLLKCRAGPHPTIVEDAEEEDESEVKDDSLSDTDDEENPVAPEDRFEEGDRLFYINLPSEAEFIRATQTVSSRLAEAHNKNARAETNIPEYLREFEDVFSKKSFDSLPHEKIWDHAIELIPDAKPKNTKVYPLSPTEQAQLDEFLQENLDSGRIRPSKSPMASPVFFIKKKDGTLRLVQDYRALNSMTIKNRYPIPLISELVNQLRGAKYFTKLDVRWGYNNVRIKKGDEWKAAFRTNRGLFEPLVMFFGLCNSPATFQTMMNDIFHDLIMEGVVCVYIDDILIFTKTIAEHRRVTKLVLQRLKEHKLYLKPEKCEFERTQIEYLGLIISEGRVEMDPVKVAAVTEWPKPDGKRGVQSFVGFVNFY
jgi:hypothetical protein